MARLSPAIALLLGGCTPFAISPALRTVPLESAETVGAERTAVSASGGAHSAEVYSATGRLRHGITDDVDLQIEATWAYYGLVAQRAPGPHAGSARIGVKHRVWEHLAFTAGLGGGYGPWGLFAGPDLGAILAYENPTLVPFLAARMQVSVPLIVQRETIVRSDGMGGTITQQLTPPVSLYFQPSIGVRIPVCREEACSGARVDLAAAISYTQLVMVDGSHPSLGAFGGEAGFEVVLP